MKSYVSITEGCKFTKNDKNRFSPINKLKGFFNQYTKRINLVKEFVFFETFIFFTRTISDSTSLFEFFHLTGGTIYNSLSYFVL